MGQAGEAHYIKIWKILTVLLVISVVGPMAEIKVLTLITAFGVALVKAYLVAKHFMHIPLEPKWLTQLLIMGMAIILVFFFGVAPDVMKHEGANWEHTTAIEFVENAKKNPPADHH